MYIQDYESSANQIRVTANNENPNGFALKKLSTLLRIIS